MRYSPIWSCSRRGLPCRELLPVARCALTAPFHPYRPAPAVYFLWHFPWAHTLQALPGALSEGARTFLCKPETHSDCLADSCFLGLAILQENHTGRSPRRRAIPTHGLAAGIIFFRNGSLRCALLPKKKIPPAALPETVGPAGVGFYLSMSSNR